MQRYKMKEEKQTLPSSKDVKMTLQGYYNSLPEDANPRRDFINKVAELCDVTPEAVRLWCKGIQFTPNQKKVQKVLSLTGGIPIKEYYYSLPEKSSPRKELVARLVKATGRSYQAVMWWVQGKHTPDDKSIKTIIALVLNINPLDLE